VLRNPRTRASYETRLGASAPRPAPAKARPPSCPRRHPIPCPRARTAEIQLMQGEKYLESEKYWDAIQSLEPAVKGLTGKARQRARVGLARAYLKNPKWVKRAEENAARRHPRTTPRTWTGISLLGRIYKQQGLKTRSHTMMRKSSTSSPITTRPRPSWPSPRTSPNRRAEAGASSQALRQEGMSEPRDRSAASVRRVRPTPRRRDRNRMGVRVRGRRLHRSRVLRRVLQDGGRRRGCPLSRVRYVS